MAYCLHGRRPPRDREPARSRGGNRTGAAAGKGRGRRDPGRRVLRPTGAPALLTGLGCSKIDVIGVKTESATRRPGLGGVRGTPCQRRYAWIPHPAIRPLNLSASRELFLFPFSVSHNVRAGDCPGVPATWRRTEGQRTRCAHGEGAFGRRARAVGDGAGRLPGRRAEHEDRGGSASPARFDGLMGRGCDNPRAGMKG